MNASPDAADGDPAVLDDLIFRYLEDLEASDSDPDELLDEFCAGQPHYDAELRGAIERLRAAGLMPAKSDEFPEHLGDFRLERRLGSGGMGVVFLAEQVSLGRRVALKLVRPEQLYFQRTRERFKREVESAARLGHAGIAQVYTVGEEGGVPYFAQEFIPGASLDVVLRAVPSKTAEGLTGRDLARALSTCLENEDLSATNGEFFEGTWETVCLRIARAVAGALQHAHERGVLHRDVKPSNLILTPNGRVVLVDFGLANLSDSGALTRTGAQLGSLPYMSPEQVDGRSEDVGPASDVYGLGVTLYELLTLRAPYGGESSETLRRLILEARALTPRTHNSALGVDAETVCLCAMDADPARRYATAAAFGADLDNVLESRPTTARPIGRVGRAVRWIQRNPTNSIAGALAGILLVGGPLFWGIMQTSHAAKMKRSAERESKASTAAEQHFRTILGTLDSMIRRIGDSDLEELPGMTADRLAAIEGALGSYELLTEKRPDDTLLAEYHTWAHHLRGTTLYEMSHFEDSVSAFEAGLERIEPTLDIQDNRQANRTWEAGSLLLMRAKSRARLQDHEGELGDATHGLEFLERAVALDSALRDRRSDFVIALTGIAASHRSVGDPGASRAALQRARGITAAWKDEPVPDADQRRAHVQLLIEEARLATYYEQYGEVLALRMRAVGLLEQWIEEYPGETEWSILLVPLLVSLAEAQDRLGEVEEQVSVVERAVSEARILVERYPHRDLYRVELLTALGRQAHLARLQGSFAEGRNLIVKVAEEWSAWLALEPHSLDVRTHTTSAWANAANVFLMSEDLGLGRCEEALRLLERADEAGDLPGMETNSALARTRRFVNYNRAVCFGQLGRIEEARECIREVEAMSMSGGGDLRYLADMWNEYFLAVERRDEFGDAELGRKARLRVLELLEEAVAAGYVDLAELRTTPSLDSLRSEPRFMVLLQALEND